MTQVKRLVLDVLKPHQPNALELATAIASLAADYQVNLHVVEVDERTESTVIAITGEELDYAAIETRINDLGGSVHSIDEVTVDGKGE
jgi:hypothetical protein